MRPFLKLTVAAAGMRYLWALTIAGALVLVPTRSHAREQPPLVEVDLALARWDVRTAERILATLPQGDALVAVKRGEIAVYEGRYADAEVLLAGALATLAPGAGAPWITEAKQFLDLARGAQKALNSALVEHSPDGYVEAVFASEKDLLLAPYLFAAIAQARDLLGREFGVFPDHAVRFEFLDDPRKLALVTPLSVEHIRTTGTVGVTKHRRIVMITPRVMLRGYGWLDTAVHEYVHYLLTLRTGNLAPVWVQEGLAKLFETQWRKGTVGVLDDTALAYRLHRALETDSLVTLDEMYPSLAMLPSAERAALAYAEVETMFGLLREQRSHGALGLLLDKIASGVDARDAFGEVWGRGFPHFFAEWKQVMRTRTAGKRDTGLRTPRFRDNPADAGDEEDLGDVFSELGGGEARKHARIGVLLQGRGHLEAAAKQYEKARTVDARARRDPALSRRLGRLYVELEQWDRATPLLFVAAKETPEDPNLAVAQALALLRVGQASAATAAADRAVRNNPFIPRLHCVLRDLSSTPAEQRREAALCPH